MFGNVTIPISERLLEFCIMDCIELDDGVGGLWDDTMHGAELPNAFVAFSCR